MSPEEAFRESCESITGPITKTISKHGVLKLYNDLSAADKKVRVLKIQLRESNRCPETQCTALATYLDSFHNWKERMLMASLSLLPLLPISNPPWKLTSSPPFFLA
jgi:hypothetical protein